MLLLLFSLIFVFGRSHNIFTDMMEKLNSVEVDWM